MSTVAIVSTSINKEPAAYAEWAKQGDLIVAGDKNSPPQLSEFIHDLGGEYLTPTEQESRWPLISETVGWNCIQRRNFAVLAAYEDLYDYVVTVDDDNSPSCGDWVEQHADKLHDVYGSNTTMMTADDQYWCDIGHVNYPRTRQRGTPYGVAVDVPRYSIDQMRWPTPVVSTAMVLGDPDCDAVFRLTNPDLQVERVSRNVVVDKLAWAAFNSQATLWHGEWAPMIACIPHVGRYDDIFASFIAKRIMMCLGTSFYAGTPVVNQDRNPHDIVNDLKEEVYGMTMTPRLIHTLDELDLDRAYLLSELYERCTRAIRLMLPPQAQRFCDRWATHWVKIENERTPV